MLLAINERFQMQLTASSELMDEVEKISPFSAIDNPSIGMVMSPSIN
jgi:hypothetical protein